MLLGCINTQYTKVIFCICWQEKMTRVLGIWISKFTDLLNICGFMYRLNICGFMYSPWISCMQDFIKVLASVWRKWASYIKFIYCQSYRRIWILRYIEYCMLIINLVKSCICFMFVQNWCCDQFLTLILILAVLFKIVRYIEHWQNFGNIFVSFYSSIRIDLIDISIVCHPSTFSLLTL